MKPVKVVDAALRQWRRIAERYDQERLGLGDEFTNEVEAALHAIAENPDTGVCVERGFQIKTLRRFPHGLVFLKRKKGCYVIAVHHERQDSAYWEQRLGSFDEA